MPSQHINYLPYKYLYKLGIKYLYPRSDILFVTSEAMKIDYSSFSIKTKNVQIEELDIWKDSAKAKEMLQRTNGARTIPQIFIGDHYIGGNDQLQESHRTGELDKLLA